MIQTIPSSPGFSLRRVIAFAQYYLPRLRTQMWIYGCVSLLSFILCILPAHEEVQKALMVGVWTVIPMLYYCGPLVFSKGSDSRIIERQMPVSAAEQLTFFYAYTLIVIPILVYLLPLAAGKIYLSCPTLQTPDVLELYKMKFNNWGILNLINFLGAIFISIACLYGVMASKQNRMLYGFVGVIVANIIVGVLGGIIGIVTAFQKGLEDGMSGAEYNPDQFEKAFVNDMMQTFSKAEPISICAVITIAVLIIITGVLTYRSIKRKNL